MSLTLGEIIGAFEKEVPVSFQEPWDASGLQIGSLLAPVKTVLFTLDVCSEVVREAIRKKAGLIVTHHPLWLKPFAKIDTQTYVGRIISEVMSHNIAVYSAHTSHDSSLHSLNRHYSGKLKLKNLRPIRIGGEKSYCKLVVFVPTDHADKVLKALFTAGAGHVGAYSCCSFRTAGTGTFKGDETTNPFIGVAGRITEANENRVEVLVEKSKIDAVVSAMLCAHPYEEVAYDIIELQNGATGIGQGIAGFLPKPQKASELVDVIKKIFRVPNIKVAGSTAKKVCSVGICTGSGTALLDDVISQKIDLFITGDVKYHHAVQAVRNNLCVVDVGHFHSEVKSASVLKNIFDGLFGSKLKLVEYTKLKDPFMEY